MGLFFLDFDCIQLIPDAMSSSVVNSSLTMLECSMCTRHPKNAVETLCCSQVTCKNCADSVRSNAQGSRSCPLCGEDLKTFPVKGALKRIIDNVSIECENGCGVTITLAEVEQHEKVCFKKILMCKFCDSYISRANFVEHLSTDHSSELTETCSTGGKSELIASEHLVDTTASLENTMDLLRPRINSTGKYAKLGETGKFYCQSRIEFACQCCNRQCGPDSGCNCIGCQQLDIKARKLTKGYYVNAQGVLSFRDEAKKSFFCLRTVRRGKSQSSIICDGNPNLRCKGCMALNKAWNDCPAFRDLHS